MQALILAGGSGTRFWPLSRRRRPKQLLALESELSLLAVTLLGEQFTAYHAVGMGLIIAGIVVLDHKSPGSDEKLMGSP